MERNENLTGHWVGEYSVSVGNKGNENWEYHQFEIELEDSDGNLKGTSKDLTLSKLGANISGFCSEGMISLIKKYAGLLYEENGEYYLDEGYESAEIHYMGRYNSGKKCFEGSWEIEVGEEREGLQDSYINEHTLGHWYMKRTSE
ncbi:MAG: hypothetical protein ABJP45_01535 [Cyclobacteriaceae bacterium]